MWGTGSEFSVHEAVSEGIGSGPFGAIHAKELKPLVAGGGGRHLAALVDVPSGRALTLDERADPATTVGDGSGLSALARTMLGRGDSADSARVRKLCADGGGLASVAMLTPECDLLISRVASTSELLCLAIRRGEAGVGGFDSIVHARAVEDRLRSAGKTTESAVNHAVAETERNYSLWQRILSALGVERAHRASQSEREQVARAGRPGRLRQQCEGDDNVLAADLFDLRSGQLVDSFRPKTCVIPPLRSEQLAALAKGFIAGDISVVSLAAVYGHERPAVGKLQVQIGQRSIYLLRIPYFPTLSIPFHDAQVLVLAKPPRANPALDWTSIDRVGLNLLRLRIGAMLASGMKTQMLPFPETQIEFQAILDRLAELPSEDLAGRLDIGGFAAHSVTLADIEQRCAECIYYLPHRKWCDLPELPVPVEPQWWCRLWKL